MWNLSRLIPSFKKCGLCEKRIWPGKVVHLEMKTVDGQYKKDICEECNHAIDYWREITEMRAKREG